jgi:hypothetical protein
MPAPICSPFWDCSPRRPTISSASPRPYDHLSNLAGFQIGGDRMNDVFDAVFAGIAADSTLVDLGYRTQRPDGTQKPYPLLFQLIYQRHQTRIPQASLIDGQPFSETETIKPYDAGKTKNYIDWLAANARSADALRAQNFGAAPKPTALLYMLLRHALLVQAGTSINRWLKLFEIDAPELVRSRKFLGMTPAVDIAAWEILSAPASAVTGTVTSTLPLLAVVQLPEYRTGIHAPIGAPLEEILAAYGVLRAVPTARLERLLAEARRRLELPARRLGNGTDRSTTHSPAHRPGTTADAPRLVSGRRRLSRTRAANEWPPGADRGECASRIAARRSR